MADGVVAWGTVYFDGDCGFCSSATDWGRRHLPPRVVFVPYQWADLAAVGLSADECEHALQYLGARGQRGSGGSAVGHLLWASGGAWRLPAVLALAPPTRWLVEGMYRLVAANRYRLPGGTPACKR